jgi:hypothetical protein
MNGSGRSSAGLVWRHQRLVWWIFAVNLGLAWLSSLPARVTLRTVLNHSLESARLVAGFDVGTFGLLMERPDVPAQAMAPVAIAAALIFLVYLWFIDGGVLTVFLEDRKLSRAEFFANAGLFFWRMVGLALISAVPFGLLMAAGGELSHYAETLANNAGAERLGFLVNVAGELTILIGALWVRMWFDLAQAGLVRNVRGSIGGGEGRIWRAVVRSLKVALRSGKLFAGYVGIGCFALGILGVGVAVWMVLPHAAIVRSFLILELATIVQIAARLWMKAASARRVALLPVEAVVTPPPVNESFVPVLEVVEVREPEPE